MRVLPEPGGNVAPCGKEGFMKGIHGLELMSVFKLPLPSIPKHSQWDLDQGSMQDGPS